MNKIYRYTAVVVLLLISASCATRVADLSVIASHNVNLDKIDLDTLPQVKRVTGKDSRIILFCIPLGMPTIEGALDDALEKSGGDLMIDAVLYRGGWWFLIGETQVILKGTVVKTRGEK
jgi:hypothetical protein